MKNQERIESLTTLLNMAPPNVHEFKQDISEYIKVRNILRDTNLCYSAIISSSSLGGPVLIYTREEAQKILATESVGPNPNLPYYLKTAFSSDVEKNTPVFLDEANENFYWFMTSFVNKLRSFVDKCIAGHIDTTFLNTHLSWEDHTAEFSATSNPMRPIFCPSLPSAYGEDWEIEKALCYRILYPLVLDPKAPLTKIKCCRNCGKYFIAKRLSATFCSDKCRGAYHYAANGD